MHAVTFQAPHEVRVDEVPDPVLTEPHEALIRVEATGVCGSDLHLYTGRIPLEQGFVLGHEYVGTVLQTGAAVTSVAPGDRVLGGFQVACGGCFFCRRGDYHKCDSSRTFGHGATLGGLPGTQAEQALVPFANLTLRRIPEGLSDASAMFAGDVMATAFHATAGSGVRAGDTVVVLGLGPVGLCAVQCARVAGAAQVLAVDSVPERLAMAERFGAQPVHLTEDDPRAAVRTATGGRGADVVVDAVGDPRALEMAIRLASKAGIVSVVGVYSERCEVHMGLLWIKSLRMESGQANVLGHLDRVLALLASGDLDPEPLVTHHLPLSEAPAAYEMFERREALKIMLTP